MTSEVEVIPTRGVAKRRWYEHIESGSINYFPAQREWPPRRSLPILAAGDEHVLVRRWTMAIRTFCTLAAAIFALIALLQLIRIVMGWSVTLNGFDVPFWRVGLPSLWRAR
jgi:hypothetical protein